MGFDGERALGNVFTHLPQHGQVLGVDGQVVDRNIVGGVLRMRPPHHGIGGGVEDILSVRAGKIGSEGDVEGVVDRRVDGRRSTYWRGARMDGRLLLLVRIDARHAHVVRPRHAKVGWAHPL